MGGGDNKETLRAGAEEQRVRAGKPRSRWSFDTSPRAGWECEGDCMEADAAAQIVCGPLAACVGMA